MIAFWFLAGMLAGGTLGVLGMALAAMASQADARARRPAAVVPMSHFPEGARCAHGVSLMRDCDECER